MGYEGTLIGPDGKRYPRGAVPAAVEASPRMDGRIYGTPLEGSVVVWSITRRRWEWSIPAAQGNVSAGTGAATWTPATGTINVAVDAAANVASARTLGTGATQAASGATVAAIDAALAAHQGDTGNARSIEDPAGGNEVVLSGADNRGLYLPCYGSTTDATGLFLVTGTVAAEKTAIVAVYDTTGTAGAPGARTAVSAATALTSDTAILIPFTTPVDIDEGDYLFVSVSDGTAQLAGHKAAAGILDFDAPPITAPTYFENAAGSPPATATPTNAYVPVPFLAAYVT